MTMDVNCFSGAKGKTMPKGPKGERRPAQHIGRVKRIFGAGLAVKARALRFDTHLSTQCDLPPKDQDWPEHVTNEFVAEIERLAAAELPRV
jgi:hypothetical protein